MTDLSYSDAGARPDTFSTRRRPDRWVSPLAALAAGFTAACCLGLSAVVSVSTSLGAVFLTRDTTLRPLLAGTLVVTVAGSALTWCRRRRTWPLMVTAAAAVWIYSFVYLVAGHAGHMADHMTDHRGGHAAGISGGRLAAVWFGLAALVASQLSDLLVARRARRAQPTSTGDGRRP